MERAAIVLLHSPLVGRASWGRLDTKLRATGYPVIVPDVVEDNRPPFAVRYVAAVGRAIDEAFRTPDGARGAADSGATDDQRPTQPPLLLIGHSGAGPLLPAVGAAQRAAGRQVRGYIFCDAHVPKPGASHLELLEADESGFAAGFRDHLDSGGLYPEWRFEDLAAVVPDPDDRRELLASLRPRGMGYFTEALPGGDDWPDAPCAYLQTSAVYASQARQAQLRGWPTLTYGEGHFLALTDPDGTAAAVHKLLDAL